VKSPGDSAQRQFQDHATKGIASGTAARIDTLGPAAAWPPLNAPPGQDQRGTAARVLVRPAPRGVGAVARRYWGQDGYGFLPASGSANAM